MVTIVYLDLKFLNLNMIMDDEFDYYELEDIIENNKKNIEINEAKIGTNEDEIGKNEGKIDPLVLVHSGSCHCDGLRIGPQVP